ncbi:MAG: 16S rRNA (guanine(966)-N(2))-methyltransferase RsmD [Aquisalimonadaceae bacterium]
MAKHGTRQIRIIGGRWRGRRLRFAGVPGLRPTADRNRETLFNWLQPMLPGAHCLDLFAGSGALGLEAASRGAHRVTLVEQARDAARLLRENADLLEADMVEIRQMDARHYLNGPPSPMDIVFLDPPFGSGLLTETFALLENNGWLAPAARIYLETDRSEGLPVLPSGWSLLRQRAAGQVVYALAGRDRPDFLQSADHTGVM